MQGLAIHLFAVRLAILPATKENPDPLESERSDNGVFRLAFCALLLVVGLGPRRGSNRVHGPLVKRLPQKLGTSPAPMHPVLLAATGEGWCNPTIGLQFAGAGVAVALRAECGNQSRRQGRTH